MFVSKSPSTSSGNRADGMATACYNKFQLLKGGPFCIIEFQLHTLEIGKNSVSDTVSIHHKKAARRLESSDKVSRSETAQQSDSSMAMSGTLPQQNDWASEDVSSKASLQTEYGAKRIVGRRRHGRRRRYIVRRYWYGRKDIMLELARKTLQHFIIRYDKKTRMQANDRMRADE